MNRKEAADLLPIIQAFAAGEAIECRLKPCTIRGLEFPNGWLEMDAFSFSNKREYRIKPKPGYRPFANAEECLKEMQKHTPFGLIKKNVSGAFYCIGSFDIKNIYIGTTLGIHSYADSLENFTFVDDTPFGVKVEE